MATDDKKADSPPYPSFATFTNFVNGLRQTGVPSRIDKGVLSKMSGSAQSALTSGLKWLDLIDEAGVPTAKLEALVNADEKQYSQELRKILEGAYAFLTNGSMDLKKGTGAQLETKFKEYGVTGSTVIKCMAFFILAAKEAGIELGPYIKAPKAPSSNGARKKAKKALQTSANAAEEEEEEEEDEGGIPDEMEGFVKISVPLHGMPDGAVFLPDNMTASQWAYALKITKFLIENYRPEEDPK
jgi:hypothetical protein